VIRNQALATNPPSYYLSLVQTQGAVAFWPMNEQKGASKAVNDGSTIGSNDGTIVGSTSSYTLGVVGQGPNQSAYQLDGGFINVASPTGIYTPETSVSGWVRVPTGQAGNGYVYYSGSAAKDGFGLGVFSGQAQGFACIASGVCATVTSGGPSLGDGNWHLLTLTKDDNGLTLYVDGLEASTHALAGDISYVAIPQINIGRNAVTGGNLLNAAVDDVSLYDHALSPSDVAALWPAGACPQSTVADLQTGPLPAAGTLPGLPLSTDGRFIVDTVGKVTNNRVKLASVNWYGFDQLTDAPAGLQCQPLSAIVQSIVSRGFNSVRLPWSTDSWNANPVVPNIAVAANPALRGLHLRDVMDKVINELARQGVLVVLDNHTSQPGWCCSETDGNALWWENYIPGQAPKWSSMSNAQKMALYNQGNNAWLSAWSNIIQRYSPSGSDPQAAVVGADLRNEPRDDTTLGIHNIWGGKGTPVYENWQQAATTAGNKILSLNPKTLIMVEGVDYGTMLGGQDDKTDLPTNPTNGWGGAGGYPIKLTPPKGESANKLVYSVHNYEWDQKTLTSTQLGQWWGYLLKSGKYYPATPVWIGEFGTCNTNSTNCLQKGAQGTWWQALTKYMSATDVDWSYWSLDGTGAGAAPPARPLYCNGSLDSGDPEGMRFEGCQDSYGILGSSWQTDADPNLTTALRKLETYTQKP